MASRLNLQDCFTDSPDFRSKVIRIEQSNAGIETTIKSLLKSTRASVAAAQEHSTKTTALAHDLSSMAHHMEDQSSICMSYFI
jgi:hypothetical protein